MPILVPISPLESNANPSTFQIADRSTSLQTVLVGVGTGVGALIGVGTGVGVLIGVGTGVGVLVGVGTGVGVLVGVGTSVGVLVGVGTGVGVLVAVGTGAGGFADVGVSCTMVAAIGGGVSVGVGCSSLHATRAAMTRANNGPICITRRTHFQRPRSTRNRRCKSSNPTIGLLRLNHYIEDSHRRTQPMVYLSAPYRIRLSARAIVPVGGHGRATPVFRTAVMPPSGLPAGLHGNASLRSWA